MFLHTAPLGALLDMKPVCAKNFTNVIRTPAVGLASFSSQQNAFEIYFISGCLCLLQSSHVYQYQYLLTVNYIRKHFEALIGKLIVF
jgi:hypothetical protein